MRGQILRSFGSWVMLLGAFAVGGVIHGVAVTGRIEPFSPLAVGGMLVGGLLIFVGFRLERRFDPSAYVPEREEADDEEEFDEELSPVSEEMMAEREADEDYQES